MPRRRRVEKMRRSELTADQEFELLGFHTPRSGGSFFADEEAKRAAWNAHADELLRETQPGHRPLSWWRYEAGLERAPDNQERWLRQHKQLTPFEERELTRMRHHHVRPLADASFILGGLNNHDDNDDS